jgi:hypothetical protein
MFSSNSARIFFVFALLFCQACGFWRGQTDAPPAPFVADEIKSAIPFSTKEPNVYQTEIVVTANGVEDVTFTARNETSRLTVYNFQTESETAILKLGENQTFLIAPQRKIYALEEFVNDAVEADSDFLTAELLNRKKDARFETLGMENNLARYRVSFEEARNSEIIVSVDEQIGLPVKQEFYSTGDGQKILTYAVELKNFSPSANAKLFEIPKDYRKVLAKEFREIIWRKQTKQK